MEKSFGMPSATNFRLNEGVFQNFISLGYFCSVALDLNALGLRSQSSPFDWVISSFPNVIDLIGSYFEGFLEKDNLFQNSCSCEQYLDQKNNIYFFHDFDKYRTFDSQYEAVYEKYKRRITRFYEAIKRPTLFIRYISSENMVNSKFSELQWIETNQNYIESTIKKYNPFNEIIYIGDESIASDSVFVFNVDKPNDDVVNRKPLFANEELLSFLKSCNPPFKERNLLRYKRKNCRIFKFLNRSNKKVKSALAKMFLKPYTHSRVY